MQVTQTVSEGLKREYRVVVPVGDLDAKVNERLVDLKDRVRINGFRPGKVPLEHLRRMYSASSVVPATIRIETTKVAPGVIHHTSPFAMVDIGPRGERVAAHLRVTGLDVRIKEDEMAMLWDKMAVLAPIALITTHERANIGEVRARRREDLEALVREFASVAAADGVAVDPLLNLAFIEKAPGTMETSMQRDQAAGRHPRRWGRAVTAPIWSAPVATSDGVAGLSRVLGPSHPRQTCARIFAFSAASIFRLAFVIVRSIYHDRTAPTSN